MLDILALLPPGLRPYAKAVAPAALALLAAIITASTTGQVAGLEVALVGLLAASVTFAVDNIPVGWRAYAKSTVPAVLTVVAVPVHFLVSGSWDTAEWALAITGLGSAVVAFLVPNEAATLGARVDLSRFDKMFGAPLERVRAESALLDTGPDGPGPVPLLADEQPAELRTARADAASQDPPTRPAA